MKTAIVLAAPALALASAPALADHHQAMGPPDAHSPMLMAGLLGVNEVADGDSDGRGQFMAWNGDDGQLCYRLMVSKIGPATMAHIHKAPVGANGGVVVGLTAPADGKSEACVAVDADLMAALWADPGAYYVNVHNEAYPAGALRGQIVSHGMAGKAM